MKIKLLLFSAIAILTIFSIACTKGNFDKKKLHKKVPYEASFALPVVYGDINLHDALKSANKSESFFVNEDGFLSFQYTGTVKSKNIEEIIKIDNQSKSHTFPYSFSLSDFGEDGVLVKEDTFNYTFKFNNSENIIDSIIIKEALNDIKIKKTSNNQVKFIITLPSVTKDGVAFSQEINLTSSEMEKSKNNIDLSGYKVELKTDPENNSLPVKISTEFISNNEANSSGTITIDFNIKDVKYKRMHGFFGVIQIMHKEEKVDITLFKNNNIDIERFFFKDPKFKVYYWNSFGMPFQLSFVKLNAHSSINGTDIPFVSSVISTNPTKPNKLLFPTNYGDIKHDSLKVNKDNSNVVDFVNSRPKWMHFEANVSTDNPSPINRTDFITDNSEISVKIALEFPLWGHVYNIRATDTTKFDFNKEVLSKNDDRVKRVMLKVDITNGFPIETHGQIYFADQNNSIIDSLFTNNERVLESAKVDGNGKVIERTRKITKIEITSDKLDKLKDCKNIIFSAVGNTENSKIEENIKIYPEYGVKFKIGVEFDVEAELEPGMKF